MCAFDHPSSCTAKVLSRASNFRSLDLSEKISGPPMHRMSLMNFLSVCNFMQGAFNFLQESHRAETIENNLLQVLHCACWISLAECKRLANATSFVLYGSSDNYEFFSSAGMVSAQDSSIKYYFTS